MSVIAVKAADLNLQAMLLNGQSFRWFTDVRDAFYGVAYSRLWKLWWTDSDNLCYKVLARKKGAVGQDETVLRRYLQVKVDMPKLYDSWSQADERLAEIISTRQDLRGIRVLAQEPFETLIAFICSANNNVKRITKLVNRLCEMYGSDMDLHNNLSPDEKTFIAMNPSLCYAFPTLPEMWAHRATMLTQLQYEGFGYRNSYIVKTIEKLHSDGLGYLTKLANKDSEVAVSQLTRLHGVGDKVAQCVCLMGLQMHHVVPIDTHIFQLTKEWYCPNVKAKMPNSALHRQIGDFYHEKLGIYAGWAQALLFNVQLAKKRGRAVLMEEGYLEDISLKMGRYENDSTSAMPDASIIQSTSRQQNPVVAVKVDSGVRKLTITDRHVYVEPMPVVYAEAPTGLVEPPVIVANEDTPFLEEIVIGDKGALINDFDRPVGGLVDIVE